jgi:hypothetical protein
MKVIIVEREGCFGMEATAETMAEAALLVRMGMNATKEIRCLSATANQDGTFGACIVLGKHRDANNDVPRRR